MEQLVTAYCFIHIVQGIPCVSTITFGDDPPSYFSSPLPYLPFLLFDMGGLPLKRMMQFVDKWCNFATCRVWREVPVCLIYVKHFPWSKCLKNPNALAVYCNVHTQVQVLSFLMVMGPFSEEC